MFQGSFFFEGKRQGRNNQFFMIKSDGQPPCDWMKIGQLNEVRASTYQGFSERLRLKSVLMPILTVKISQLQLYLKC